MLVKGFARINKRTVRVKRTRPRTTYSVRFLPRGVSLLRSRESVTDNDDDNRISVYCTFSRCLQYVEWRCFFPPRVGDGPCVPTFRNYSDSKWASASVWKSKRNARSSAASVYNTVSQWTPLLYSDIVRRESVRKSSSDDVFCRFTRSGQYSPRQMLFKTTVPSYHSNEFPLPRASLDDQKVTTARRLVERTRQKINKYVSTEIRYQSIPCVCVRSRRVFL